LVDAAISGQQQNYGKKGEKEDVKEFNKVSDIILPSIGTTAHCGLWPVEQCPSVFFLSGTNSVHLLTPST